MVIVFWDVIFQDASRQLRNIGTSVKLLYALSQKRACSISIHLF